jgi:4-diphosphocytidyl-2-C-methyl-D-erythritol kinase
MMHAYAKINLGLYVVARRPDGYHDIETVFCRVGISDVISFSPASEICVSSTSPHAPSDATNICHAAARLLQDLCDTRIGVHIHITKNIPVGAGLGGGSADAAIVLNELPAFWGRDIDQSDRFRLALALGSDVPFFLGKGAALGRGRGEQLEYFPLDIPFTILLCNPNIHIPTGWAYSRIVPGTRGKPDDLKKTVQDGMRAPGIMKSILRNDFEDVVFGAYPEVGKIKERMLDAGAQFSLMSGSGSTVFGLFETREAAQTLADQFSATGFRTFITPPHFTV